MKKSLLVSLALLFVSVSLTAQTAEDGLRYTKTDGLVTSRAGGLGISYLGISDDNAAMSYNPAGMTLVPINELNFGFGFMLNSSESRYRGTVDNYAAGDGYVTNLGIVSPIVSSRNKSAFGLGYFYESNYKSIFGFSAYNPDNSLIEFETKNGPQVQDNANNWAYELYLANPDEAGNIYQTEYTGDIDQENYTRNDGGMHNLTGSYAFNLTRDIALGFNLTMKFGRYEYYREYFETPLSTNYTPIEERILRQMTLEEFYNTDAVGITGKIGLMATPGKHFRIGVTVDLPTYLSFEESYGKFYRADFTNGSFASWSPYSNYPDDTLYYDYSLLTPFVYSAGASFNAAGVTLTTGIEFQDPTQLNFFEGADELDELNRQMELDLSPQLKWGVGAEWEIPFIPASIRAGVEGLTTPYADESGMNYLAYSGGMSYYVGKSVRLDIAAKYMQIENEYMLYGGNNTGYKEMYSLTESPFNISFGMAYRFR